MTGVKLGLTYIVARTARREENRVFALLAVSVALWTQTNALLRITAPVDLATLWAQLSYLAALATAAACLHFSWIYQSVVVMSGRWAKRSRWKRNLWLTGASIASVFIPRWVIRGVDLEARRIVTGNGLSLIAVFLLATSAMAFVLFYQASEPFEP